MKKCAFCSQEFQETRYKAFYCNHKCQAKAAIKKANLKKKPKPRCGVTLKCIVCGKDFYVPQYRAKLSVTKYCSRSCLAKNHLAKYFPVYGFKKTGKKLHEKYKVIYINGKQVREHRWIMEQHIGRKLETWEHVHHINDNPLDNRIENLEVLSNSEHQKKELLFRKSIFSSQINQQNSKQSL